MKTHRLLILVVLGLLATACAPVSYEGPYVSQPVYRDSYAYPVPVVVHVDQRQQHHRARIEQELANRHRRAAAIYRGGGRPGELVEVYIHGGYFNHQGKRIKYSPARFRIAAGDIIRFPATGTDLELYVRFQNGRLAMDTDIFGSFSYVNIAVDLGPDHSRERSYRLHNNYLRDARVVVRGVAPNRSHIAPKKVVSRKPVVVKPRVRTPDHNREHYAQPYVSKKDEERDRQRRAEKHEPEVIKRNRNSHQQAAGRDSGVDKQQGNFFDRIKAVVVEQNRQKASKVTERRTQAARQIEARVDNNERASGSRHERVVREKVEVRSDKAIDKAVIASDTHRQRNSEDRNTVKKKKKEKEQKNKHKHDQFDESDATMARNDR